MLCEFDSGLIIIRPVTAGLDRKVLDRESRPGYTYIIFAGDASQTATATLSISIADVNDNTPTFTENSYLFTVQENSLPTVLGQVRVRLFIQFFECWFIIFKNTI